MIKYCPSVHTNSKFLKSKCALENKIANIIILVFKCHIYLDCSYLFNDNQDLIMAVILKIFPDARLFRVLISFTDILGQERDIKMRFLLAYWKLIWLSYVAIKVISLYLIFLRKSNLFVMLSQNDLQRRHEQSK